MTLSKSPLSSDLNDLDIKSFANHGIEVEVVHPVTGIPLKGLDGEPWIIKLIGKDSDKYRKLNSDIIQRRFTNQSDRQKITPEDIEEERHLVLSGCILDWKNFVKDSQVFHFSKENAEYMVRQFPWFAEQIESVIISRERYFLANTRLLNNM